MSTTTKVITGEVRFSYAHVHEPVAITEGQEKKYSVAILIPKSDKTTLAKVEAAIKAAFEKGKAEYGGTLPKTWKNPLRDGDEKENDDDGVYAGHMFVNANSLQKPGIVDANRDPIMDNSEFYSGCYGRASITFFPYNFNGTKGVGCGLNNLQKLRDGENLGGVGASAEDDFSDDLLD